MHFKHALLVHFGSRRGAQWAAVIIDPMTEIRCFKEIKKPHNSDAVNNGKYYLTERDDGAED
jgi:hypothetical protein